jgi:hypothetical protein
MSSSLNTECNSFHLYGLCEFIMLPTCNTKMTVCGLNLNYKLTWINVLYFLTQLLLLTPMSCFELSALLLIRTISDFRDLEAYPRGTIVAVVGIAGHRDFEHVWIAVYGSAPSHNRLAAHTRSKGLP